MTHFCTNYGIVILDNWHSVLSDPIKGALNTLENIIGKLQKSIYFLFLQVSTCIFEIYCQVVEIQLINFCSHNQETHKLILDKIPIGIKGYRHRHDIVFSQALATVVTSFVFQLQSSILDNAFLIQLQDIGFLLHWESLLSTHGDEIGMLEDFIVVMQNMNSLSIKIVSSNDSKLRIEGKRYNNFLQIPRELH